MSRQAILSSAQAKFAAHGFEGASVRAIAQDAGVDAALIHHFFVSKEGLFTASIQDAIHPESVVEAVLGRDRRGKGVRGIGERLVRAFLGLWEGEDTSQQMRSVLRSAVTHEKAAKMLREVVMREVLLPIAHAAGKPQPEARAALASSQLIGLAMTRYIVHIEPVASLDPEDVVTYLGPTIQRYLTGTLPEPSR